MLHRNQLLQNTRLGVGRLLERTFREEAIRQPYHPYNVRTTVSLELGEENVFIPCFTYSEKINTWRMRRSCRTHRMAQYPTRH
jgi:hypothetical protein